MSEATPPPASAKKADKRTVKTAQRPLWHPACWPSWFGLALLWLLARLPPPLLNVIGRRLGPLIWTLGGSRRRIARRNLELCFPDMAETERNRLWRAQGHNLGRMLTEFALAWMGSHRAIDRIKVSYSGLEHLQDAAKAGRGVILVGGHFSHLELCGRLLTRRIELAGMYREHHDPTFEWGILRSRLRYACAMFRRDELRQTLRYLKRGGVLWYAPDQDYKRGEQVFAPFFGVPASTLTATHQLARLSGAAVMGFFHRRREDGSYEIRIAPALEQFPSKDAAADTARINRMLEQMVLEAPAQYLWVHQRFKARPAGEASLYR